MMMCPSLGIFGSLSNLIVDRRLWPVDQMRFSRERGLCVPSLRVFFHPTIYRESPPSLIIASDSSYSGVDADTFLGSDAMRGGVVV